jgi:hypothetical protein
LVGRRDLQDGCEVAGRLLVHAFARIRRAARQVRLDRRCRVGLGRKLPGTRLDRDIR